MANTINIKRYQTIETRAKYLLNIILIFLIFGNLDLSAQNIDSIYGKWSLVTIETDTAKN